MILLGCKLPLQSVKTALNPQHPKKNVKIGQFREIVGTEITKLK